jgi:hypothetical protein
LDGNGQENSPRTKKKFGVNAPKKKRLDIIENIQVIVISPSDESTIHLYSTSAPFLPVIGFVAKIARGQSSLP